MPESLINRLAALKDVLASKDIVIISDMEGPFLLGDTALQVMSKYVRPEKPLNPTIDYGAELYAETYEWFNTHFKSVGIGQEGSDIAFCVAPLLAMGVNDDNIAAIANDSRYMPGIEKFIEFITSNNGGLIGVTTAWEKYHAPILRKLGFMQLFGSAFSLDDISRSKQLEKELAVTRQYLRDCFTIMDSYSNADRAIKLRQRIEKFYITEIHLSFGKEVPERKTVLGSLIKNDLYVVGDIGKYNIAQSIKELCSADALVMTMGDGLNDVLMLKHVGLSLGINGRDAAKAAALGVLTTDMSILIDLVKIARVKKGKITDIFKEFNRLHPDTIHMGGEEMSDDILSRHIEMRHKLKKEHGLIP